MADDSIGFQRLRIAFCVYRGNPYSGGQGVYTKYLTAALSDLGHRVTVFSGPPYPDLDERVELVQVASLDLYRESDPFRIPKLSEFRSWFDLFEYLLMATGAFPEPRIFGYRVKRLIEARLNDFDVIHDNQSLSWSLLNLQQKGVPLVASIHHPITVDRGLEIKAARSVKARLGARRWYSFVKYQTKVAQRINKVVTVSDMSAQDMNSSMGIDLEKVKVIPIGVDASVFRPLDGSVKRPYQILTTASADVTLKGLRYLVDALYLLVEKYPLVKLVIVGPKNENSEVQMLVRDLGLGDRVDFLGKIPQEEIVKLYSESTVACVPSLYEGFSLPAIEAMACAIPLVVTDGGALPDVVGREETSALIARAGDSRSLAECISRIFDDPRLATSLAHHARLRVLASYSWRSAALATTSVYLDSIGAQDGAIALPSADKLTKYHDDDELGDDFFLASS